MTCYCGNSQDYAKCCGKYHSGAELPPTAEALMRSRFSAFATKNLDYLFQTLHPQNRFEFDLAANKQWAEQADFKGLEILKAEENGTKGTVDFKATYVMQSETHVHHEIGTFRKQDGQWFYKQGKIVS